MWSGYITYGVKTSGTRPTHATITNLVILTKSKQLLVNMHEGCASRLPKSLKVVKLEFNAPLAF